MAHSGQQKKDYEKGPAPTQEKTEPTKDKTEQEQLEDDYFDMLMAEVNAATSALPPRLERRDVEVLEFEAAFDDLEEAVGEQGTPSTPSTSTPSSSSSATAKTRSRAVNPAGPQKPINLPSSASSAPSSSAPQPSSWNVKPHGQPKQTAFGMAQSRLGTPSSASSAPSSSASSSSSSSSSSAPSGMPQSFAELWASKWQAKFLAFVTSVHGKETANFLADMGDYAATPTWDQADAIVKKYFGKVQGIISDPKFVKQFGKYMARARGYGTGYEDDAPPDLFSRAAEINQMLQGLFTQFMNTMASS